MRFRIFGFGFGFGVNGGSLHGLREGKGGRREGMRGFEVDSDVEEEDRQTPTRIHNP